MTFLGLPKLWVAALGAGGFVAAVLLYLRQWGRRRVVVSFSPLWKRVLSEADVGTSRRRVLELLSLLLQATVIVLLVLALGRPLVGRQPSTQVIVLDTSASMLAQRPPRGDRLSAAKQRALELLERFSDEDRVALVTTGGDARLVFAPTRDHYTLRERIAGIEPCACEGRLREAVDLAHGLAGGVGQEHGTIWVLTDGNEALEPEAAAGLRVELFGNAAPNVGITLFGVRPAPAQPGRYEAALEVSNFTARTAKAQLRISVDGQLVDLRELHLLAGERQHVPVPALVAGSGEGLLKAELYDIDIDGGAVDALAEDNRAYALLAPETERPVRLLAPKNGARFVREVLRSNPRYRLLEPDAAKPDADSGAITVVDGVPVPTGPGRYLVLAPPAGATGTQLADALVSDWRSDHPLLRHVSFEGIRVRAGRSIAPPAGAQILARSGDIPLLYVREAPERVEVGTTFDAEDSNFPMRVAFPVFVYSAIDWLAGVGVGDSDKALGRRWRLERLGLGAPKRLAIDGPSRRAEISARGDAILVDGANQPGLYRITVDDETFRIAASLSSPQESNVETRASFTAGTAPQAALDLWSWLLYAALAVLCLEWILYHRRVTS